MNINKLYIYIINNLLSFIWGYKSSFLRFGFGICINLYSPVCEAFSGLLCNTAPAVLSANFSSINSPVTSAVF